MNFARVARFHPVAVVGLIGALLVGASWVSSWEYDQNGIATALFLGAQIFGVGYSILGGLLSAVNGGDILPNHTAWVLGIGVPIHLFIDAWVTRWLGSNAKGPEPTDNDSAMG